MIPIFQVTMCPRPCKPEVRLGRERPTETGVLGGDGREEVDKKAPHGTIRS